MSWWESASGFTNLASQALKTAQKRIDKVLDIKEEEIEGSSTYTPELVSASSPSTDNTEKQDGNFFDNWLGSEGGGVSAMFLSPKASEPATTSTSSATALSLKDKLEKKRAARAAKKNASKIPATKVVSIDGEKKVQTLGSHPQSAFTAFGSDTAKEKASANAENISENIMNDVSDSSEVNLEQPHSDNVQTEPLVPAMSDESLTLKSEYKTDRVIAEPPVNVTTEQCNESAFRTENLENHIDSVEKPFSEESPMPAECKDGDKIIATEEEVLYETKSEGQVSCDDETESGIEVPEEPSHYVAPLATEALDQTKTTYDSQDSCQPTSTPDIPTEAVIHVDSGDNKTEPEMSTSQIMAGSGWDDVSLSVLISSQMSTVPESEDANQTPATKVQLETEVQDNAPQGKDVSDNEGWEGTQLEVSWDRQALESSTATDSSLEVVTKDQVISDSEAQGVEQVLTDTTPEPQTEDIPAVEIEVSEEKSPEEPAVLEYEEGEGEGGEWNNDDMILEVVSQQGESGSIQEAFVTEGETKPSEDVPQAQEPSAEEEFLTGSEAKNKSLEESSSTSETMDELSESNKTLTGEDIEQSRASSEANETESETNMVVEDKQEQEAVAEEDKQEESDSKTSSPQSHLSSSSYVKNMLEEAMVESVKDTDSHTDSHSSSDMVRIESGHTSGHTSADEVDTTTSSDIEIISHISTPTPNGDGLRMDRPFDLSPLRHALSRSVRRGSPPGHKRSDSGSSGQSYQSRNGDELLSPDGVHHHRLGEQDHPDSDRHKDRNQDDQGTDQNNPLETEKLLKDAKVPTLQPIEENSEHAHDSYVDKLVTPNDDSFIEDELPRFSDENILKASIDNRDLAKKLAEVSEVLDAREKKLVSLSQENMDLVEANTILRTQLHQAEEAHEAEMEDLNALSEEFTHRIAESERKLQAALREKEAIKKKLQEAEIEIVKRSDNTATERVLREKEQIISELLEEGEKLSKQQLQSNNIIKKLRAKEKENESSLKSMRLKIDEQKAEVERLEKILDTKVDTEKAQGETISQLNLAVKRQETEIARLMSELEDSQEKCRGLKATLDNSYKEIAELHKAKATHASEAHKAALSAEMQAKEELKVALEEFQVLARRQQEALVTQIEDLQLSMSRMEKEQGRREDILRQEISDLQQRLQEAEGRNQELTQSVTAATRPLLRQIENLQSTYTAQSDSYEKVERNLTERLADAQSQLGAAVEKERQASEKVLEATMRLATLESQAAALRQDKSRLQAQLEMERAKVEVLEEAKNSDTAHMESMIQSKDREISELKKEKIMVENQLEMEKMKVESEKKKLTMAHEQLREKELALQARTAPSPGRLSREGSMVGGMVPDSPMNMSLQSLSSSMVLSQTEDSLEKSLLMTASTNGNKMSLYETLRQGSATALVENLQAQLKQREGEIHQLQSDISELEKTREAMARELVNLSTDKEDLETKVEDLSAVQKQYQDLDARYNALLQMYGEKEEEVQELRLDLQDIKDMYKAQINELLKSK